MRGTATLRVCLVAAAIPTSATLWSLRPQAISLGFVSLCVWLIATRRTPRPLSRLLCVRLGQLPRRARSSRSCSWAAPLPAAARLRPFARARTVHRAGVVGGRDVRDAARRLVVARDDRVARQDPIDFESRSGSLPALLQPADVAFWLVAACVIVLAWRRRRELNGTDAIVIGMALALLPLALQRRPQRVALSARRAAGADLRVARSRAAMGGGSRATTCARGASPGARGPRRHGGRRAWRLPGANPRRSPRMAALARVGRRRRSMRVPAISTTGTTMGDFSSGSRRASVCFWTGGRTRIRSN